MFQMFTMPIQLHANSRRKEQVIPEARRDDQDYEMKTSREEQDDEEMNSMSQNNLTTHPFNI